jgi:ferritin-like protein
MERRLSRAELLAVGARRGAAVLVAGSAAGLLADDAAADPLTDNDLAFARVLVAVELLSTDFYLRAMNSGRFKPVGQKYLRNTFVNEVDHNRTVSDILTGAGDTPATASDFEFLYPKRAFSSRVSIATLGRDLETVSLGAYLGAVGGVQAQALLQPIARIATSEAQHLSLWAFELGGHPLSAAFPAPLTIDQVSSALDQFTA